MLPASWCTSRSAIWFTKKSRVASSSGVKSSTGPIWARSRRRSVKGWLIGIPPRGSIDLDYVKQRRVVAVTNTARILGGSRKLAKNLAGQLFLRRQADDTSNLPVGIPVEDRRRGRRADLRHQLVVRGELREHVGRDIRKGPRSAGLMLEECEPGTFCGKNACGLAEARRREHADDDVEHLRASAEVLLRHLPERT